MNCKSCNLNSVRTKLNFGKQPPSNRYQLIKDAESEFNSLEIGICSNCGLVQLINPMPIEMVRSRFSWIKYNEPELHLDNLVDELIKLPNINRESKIVGLTYKDESTLNRFLQKGFLNIKSTTMPKKKSPNGPFNGLETIQQIITEDNDFKLESEIDLLIARHVLEHAHDLTTFLKNIVKKVKKEGYLVFEIPDSKKFLEYKNYFFVWEEHIVYFTESTLRYFFEKNGFNLVNIFRYEAALEDSLVAVVTKTYDERSNIANRDIENEIMTIDLFADKFSEIKKTHQDFFRNDFAAGKRIAVFGAGHLAVKYINFFALKDFISCVIDDSKDKENLFMPGSSLPIRNSTFLFDIDICILVLSPESQIKVMKLKRNIIKKGGKFYSAFDNKLISI